MAFRLPGWGGILFPYKRWCLPNNRLTKIARAFILRGQMSIPRRNGRSIDGNSRGQTLGTSEVMVSY